MSHGTRRCGMNESVHYRDGEAFFSATNEAVFPSILYPIGSITGCSIAPRSSFCVEFRPDTLPKRSGDFIFAPVWANVVPIGT